MKKIIGFAALFAAVTFALPAKRGMKDHGGKGPMMHGKMMEMMDADKDGKVSKQEWQDFHDKRFAEMDADKDGFITKDEMKAMHEKMMQKHGKMKGEGKRGKKKKPKKDDDE